MFKVTMTFRARKGKYEQAHEAVWRLMGSLSRNGQTVGQDIITADASRAQLGVTTAAHERDSLAPKNTSGQGKSDWSRLNRLLQRKPAEAWELFSEPVRVCGCGRLQEICLAPSPLTPASPLECMQCEGRVPLYRLKLPHPVGEAGPYEAIRNFEAEWSGAYWMWLNSGAVEETGWRLIADPASPLFQDGLEICRILSRRVKTAIYLNVLSYFAEKNGLQTQLCPKCGGRLKRIDPPEALACRRCRIRTDEAIDAWPPKWWRSPAVHRPWKKKRRT